MVQRRRSIHGRDSISPQRYESDEEDELFVDDSLDSTKSGSDLEELEERSTNTYTEYEKRNRFGMSRTPPGLKIKPECALPVIECTTEFKKPFFMIFSVMAVLTAIYVCLLKDVKSDVKSCSFEILQEQYPKENPYLWNHLKVGIESILNERTQKPAVYLFAHHGGQHVFKLIKKIAAYSSNCFGKTMTPIQMEGDDFLSTPGTDGDYGYAIQKYRNKIKEGNVILIANLNEIPAKAARALHTICDTHTPIAKDVVIFLTLTIQPNIEGSANAIAEETLIELWGSKLDRNELDPLITRVTDQVIILKG